MAVRVLDSSARAAPRTSCSRAATRWPASPAGCATAPGAARAPGPVARLRSVPGTSATSVMARSSPHPDVLPGQHLHRDPRGHRSAPRRRSGAPCISTRSCRRGPRGAVAARLISSSVDTVMTNTQACMELPPGAQRVRAPPCPTTAWSCPPAVPDRQRDGAAAGGGHARRGLAPEGQRHLSGRRGAGEEPDPGRGVPDDRARARRAPSSPGPRRDAPRPRPRESGTAGLRISSRSWPSGTCSCCPPGARRSVS